MYGQYLPPPLLYANGNIYYEERASVDTQAHHLFSVSSLPKSCFVTSPRPFLSSSLTSSLPLSSLYPSLLPPRCILVPPSPPYYSAHCAFSDRHATGIMVFKLWLLDADPLAEIYAKGEGGWPFSVKKYNFFSFQKKQDVWNLEKKVSFFKWYNPPLWPCYSGTYQKKSFQSSFRYICMIFFRGNFFFPVSSFLILKTYISVYIKKIELVPLTARVKALAIARSRP